MEKERLASAEFRKFMLGWVKQQLNCSGGGDSAVNAGVDDSFTEFQLSLMIERIEARAFRKTMLEWVAQQEVRGDSAVDSIVNSESRREIVCCSCDDDSGHYFDTDDESDDSGGGVLRKIPGEEANLEFSLTNINHQTKTNEVILAPTGPTPSIELVDHNQSTMVVLLHLNAKGPFTMSFIMTPVLGCERKVLIACFALHWSTQLAMTFSYAVWGRKSLKPLAWTSLVPCGYFMSTNLLDLLNHRNHLIFDSDRCLETSLEDKTL